MANLAPSAVSPLLLRSNSGVEENSDPKFLLQLFSLSELHHSFHLLKTHASLLFNFTVPGEEFRYSVLVFHRVWELKCCF